MTILTAHFNLLQSHKNLALLFNFFLLFPPLCSCSIYSHTKKSMSIVIFMQTITLFPDVPEATILNDVAIVQTFKHSNILIMNYNLDDAQGT